jgi:hypothetical protein
MSEHSAFGDDRVSDHKLVSDSFWQNQSGYPLYDHVETRHMHDKRNIDHEIARYFRGQRRLSFCEIGCGTGEIVRHFVEKYSISSGYACDLNPAWIRDLTSQFFTNFIFEVEDISKRQLPYPETDICVSNGVFIYIFEDAEVINVLSRIRSKVILLRLPCSLESGDVLINKESDQLKSRYSALYRKPSHFLALAESAGLQVLQVKRAWPDAVESKFGTKQFLFVMCRRCDPVIVDEQN